MFYVYEKRQNDIEDFEKRNFEAESEILREKQKPILKTFEISYIK